MVLLWNYHGTCVYVYFLHCLCRVLHSIHRTKVDKNLHGSSILSACCGILCHGEQTFTLNDIHMKKDQTAIFCAFVLLSVGVLICLVESENPFGILLIGGSIFMLGVQIITDAIHKNNLPKT